jgi:hypothetical protein
MVQLADGTSEQPETTPASEGDGEEDGTSEQPETTPASEGDGTFSAVDFPNLPDGLDQDTVGAPICNEGPVKAALRLNRDEW